MNQTVQADLCVPPHSAMNSTKPEAQALAVLMTSRTVNDGRCSWRRRS